MVDLLYVHFSEIWKDKTMTYQRKTNHCWGIYKKRMQIRVQPDLLKRVQAKARQRNETTSEVIRRALEAYASGDMKLVA
jgi:hypothetical protein